jgi:hypothetical protein
MLFNLDKTFRSLTISPMSTAVAQAHRMARRRLLEAGGAAVSARGRVDDGAGKRPARVPITAPARPSRSVTVDLPGALVDRLIELGHLRQHERYDRNQVKLALYRLLDYSAPGDAAP